MIEYLNSSNNSIISYEFPIMCNKLQNATAIQIYFQLHNDFHLLLMNLIFAEMIMALFGVPVNFAASLQKGWKMGQTVCEAFGFSITLESKL